MKFCVFGAGAIGGTIAARLAIGGAETSVVARGPHLAAIRARGLRFETPEGTTVLKVAAAEDPADLGPQDVVVAAVKAHDLAASAGALAKLLHADTAVVYAINGLPWWYFHKAGGAAEGRQIERLDPGGRLWNEVGVDRTIGCVVNLPSKVPQPGVIHYEGGNNRLALGELGGEQSARLKAIATALRAGGLTIDMDRPIRAEMWTKLAQIMASSPIAVLTASPTGKALADDAGIRAIFRALLTEAGAIAAAHGFPQEPVDDARIARQRSTGHRPSILQDLDAGRPMEIDAQLVVPLELARAAGVAVPTLDLLASLVRARARAAGLYRG